MSSTQQRLLDSKSTPPGEAKLAGLFFSPTSSFIILDNDEPLRAAASVLAIDTVLTIANVLAGVRKKKGSIVDNTMSSCTCLDGYHRFVKAAVPDIEVVNVKVRFRLMMVGVEIAITGTDKATGQIRCHNLALSFKEPDLSASQFIKEYLKIKGTASYERIHRHQEYQIIEDACAITVVTPMKEDEDV